jgi:tetratricopeptide (TPR) repeat protein
LLAVPAAALAVVALGSLLAPWLSARRVDAAWNDVDRGRYAGAVSQARSAHRWNPLSVEPLQVWAAASTLRGDAADALVRYKQAAVLQHEDSNVWYDLGSYEFDLGDYPAAYKYLDISYGLDRYGYAGRPGSVLDQVRAKLGR